MSKVNLRRLRREREYPQSCRFCNVGLVLGKTVSSYIKWKKGICNRCWKTMKKTPPPRKIKKKDRKIKDSIPQRVLFEELKLKLGGKYLRYNYPIRTQKLMTPPEEGLPKKKKWSMRFGDVVHTKARAIFEYDGEYYHEEETDCKRDDELRWAGWRVIHVNKHNMQSIIDRCETLV